MITFIVYDMHNKDGVTTTHESIYKECNSRKKDYCIMYVDKMDEALNHMAIVSTMYAVILKAGDTLDMYPVNEYSDLLGTSGSSDSKSIRGIRLGADVIEFLDTYSHVIEPYMDNGKWTDASDIKLKDLLLSRFELVETDIYKVTLNK